MLKSYKLVDVLEVEELDYTEDVYDITVEDNHNFFANGVVVHNCVGGLPSSLIYREFADKKFGDLSPDLLTGPAAEEAVKNIRGRLENMADRFVDCVGRDNFFLELQFNDLSAQHLTNKCLIDLSQSTGIQLVATADSHFPSPDKWQARELYKKLGWMGAKLDKTMMPKLEDMKTMLYPKNAEQMWEEFKKGYAQYDFYQGNEELVRDAIERTHDIAWQKCEDTWVDTSVKLPKIGTPEKSAFSMLSALVKEGLVREGLADKPEYVARAKEELSDIKHLGHEPYFLAMYEVFKLAEKRTLMGPGRGSAAGSLLNFLLGITQFDPLPYGLLWGRFLGRHRCLQKDTLVMTESGAKPIQDLELGEKVLTSGGTYERVVDKEDDVNHDVNAIIKTSRDNFSCSPNHRWLVKRDGHIHEVMTTDLRRGDKLLFIKQKSP